MNNVIYFLILHHSNIKRSIYNSSTLLSCTLFWSRCDSRFGDLLLQLVIVMVSDLAAYKSGYHEIRKGRINLSKFFTTRCCIRNKVNHSELRNYFFKNQNVKMKVKLIYNNLQCISKCISIIYNFFSYIYSIVSLVRNDHPLKTRTLLLKIVLLKIL